MTMVPRVMMRLAAESEGKEGDSVAKLPWETESQTPTPNRPHPPNCNTNTQRKCKHSVLTLSHSVIHVLILIQRVWNTYPEQQVEEEEHVLHAADTATSHG